MGCDIHIHAEIKVNGVWHHYSHPRLERDYRLFTAMAGVRDYSGERDDWPKPMFERRGFPDDATFTTKVDFERYGGHSPSWLTGEEMSRVAKWWDDEHNASGKRYASFKLEQLGYLFGGEWDGKPDIAGFEGARVVFWFDS